jgi:hypothetical protein
MPLRWESVGLLDEALRSLPLEQIYNEAEEESQILVAEAESLGSIKKAAWGYQDCVIRALLRWFKRDVFTWVNNPTRTRCHNPTVLVEMTPPTEEEQARSAAQVEAYNAVQRLVMSTSGSHATQIHLYSCKHVVVVAENGSTASACSVELWAAACGGCGMRKIMFGPRCSPSIGNAGYMWTHAKRLGINRDSIPKVRFLV